MVNSYCLACGIDTVYPLLEDVPIVTEDFITSDQYLNLNSYSDKTVGMMIIRPLITKPNSYLELKSLIRNLIDKLDRTTVFFTIKNLYYDDWDYYDRNKIILQLLNKTRRRR